MRITGRAWKYGDNVDTDVMYPSQYLGLFDPEQVKVHAMEGLEPGFQLKISPGDVVVAGTNFGCGSTREQAALALKAAGVGVVVAESFARTFFRNAINVGLAVVVAPGISTRVDEGDELQVELDLGVVANLTRGERVPAEPLAPLLREILRQGGATRYYSNRMD